MRLANIYSKLPHPTIIGVIYLVASLAIMVWAIGAKNSYLLMVAAFLLAIWLICGVINAYVPRDVEIHRVVPADIFVGDEVEIKFIVTNRKSTIPTIGLNAREIVPRELRNYVSGLVKEAPILPVLPGHSNSGVYWCRFLKRGLLALTDIELTSKFPAALFVTRRPVAYRSSFVAFPALYRVKSKFQEHIAALEAYSALATQRGQGDEEFRSLREYQHGDSLRYIHWRTSAKWDKLLVREYEPPQIESAYIFLDARVPPDHRRKQIRFERAISIAASFMYHLALLEKKIWFAALKEEPDWVGPFTLGSAMYQLFNHLALLKSSEKGYPSDRLVRLCTEFTSSGLVIIISLDDNPLEADEETREFLNYKHNFLYITPQRYGEFVELTKVQPLKLA